MYQLYIVGGDFLPQQATRGTVMHSGHDQSSRQVPEPRDDDERDLLTFAPRHGANPPVGDKAGLGLDAVGIKTTADPAAQRNEVAVVDEHHADAEQLRRKAAAQLRRAAHDIDGVIRQQSPEHHSKRKLQAVIARLRAAPGEQGRRSTAKKSQRVDTNANVGYEKPDAQRTAHEARQRGGTAARQKAQQDQAESERRLSRT